MGDIAEIGCAYCGFSEKVLSTWKGTGCYFMVDLWAKQDGGVYKESTNDTAPFSAWEANCRAIMSGHSRCCVLKAPSVLASTSFKDGSLDCVYIDANHSYEAVMQDLRHWWPKVRSGGLVSGHDYYNSIGAGHYCEVEKACLEFFGSKNLKCEVWECSSWMLTKP